MLFSKAVVTTIDQALRSSKSQVPLSAVWRDLHVTYGVGSRTGSSKILKLAQADYRLLRTLVKQHAGLDLLDVDGSTTLAQMTNASRLEIAAHLPNEKLSGVSVTHDMVLIGSHSGHLTLADGEYRIPVGSAMSCHHSQLRGLDTIVLVENLALMYALHRYQWPDAVVGHLMLFRGSNQQSPAAVTKALDGVKRVICFPDFDPQGLMNSLTQRKSIGMVLPSAASIAALSARGLNKAPEFAKQEVARGWLARNAANLSCVQHMLSERLALSQEAMLGCDLDVVECGGG